VICAPPAGGPFAGVIAEITGASGWYVALELLTRPPTSIDTAFAPEALIRGVVQVTRESDTHTTEVLAVSPSLTVGDTSKGAKFTPVSVNCDSVRGPFMLDKLTITGGSYENLATCVPTRPF